MKKNPHHTREFRIMRGVAIWLYDSSCHNCQDHFVSIHVHHLDHNSENNSLLNLVCLCSSCHTLYHKIPKQNPNILKYIIVLLLKKIVYYSKKSK